MRSRPFLTGASLAALTLALLAGVHPALAETRLRILHINDLHSRIEPINKQDSTCMPGDAEKGGCFGGVARLKSAIDARREGSADPVLVLDAGDQFQGSLFYSFYKGEDAAGFLNAFRFDAMAVGNHEFDDGPDVLGAFASTLKLPLLMANGDVSGEPALRDKILPSTVVEKNGLRIGIIGLTPKDAAELSSPGPRVSFSEPVEAVRREVARLEKSGVTHIVLLSHSGFAADKRLAAAVDGIDVIVGGHSHTLLSNTAEQAEGPYPTRVASPSGVEVPIVQAGAYGRFLGDLTLTFDEAGRVTKAEGDTVLLDTSVPEDEAVKAKVAELGRPLEAMRRTVVAHVGGPLDGGRETCRKAECTMGRLVADAMLDRVKNQGVTIALTNGGGLRASIDAGEVTMGEVLTVLPFQNTLSTFRMTGADLVAALENGVSQVETDGGRFPQVAGLQFDWTDKAPPEGGRIKAVRVEGADGVFSPIDRTATYGVVSNDYMRRGGDGYAVLKDKALDPYDFGPTIDSVVIDYLGDRPDAYEPHTDGLIRKVE